MTALTSLVNAGEPKGPQDGADWQLWAYSSAAPALPGSNANVLALDGSVLREGSNDWTRVIGNPRPAPKSGWASGAAGVTQAHGGMFVKVRPFKFRRLVFDEAFVILGHGEGCFTPFAMSADDDLLNGWHFIEQRLE